MIDRVGVVHRFEHDDRGYVTKVEFLGYGNYLGEEVPPPGIMFMGFDMNKMGDETAKLQLDNGDIVWGCECYYRSEEEIKRDIAGKEILEVSIHDVRGKSQYGTSALG